MSEEIIDRIEDFVQSHKTVLYLFFINLVILLIFWGGLLHNQYNADTIFYRYQDTGAAISMRLEEGRYMLALMDFLLLHIGINVADCVGITVLCNIFLFGVTLTIMYDLVSDLDTIDWFHVLCIDLVFINVLASEMFMFPESLFGFGFGYLFAVLAIWSFKKTHFIRFFLFLCIGVCFYQYVIIVAAILLLFVVGWEEKWQLSVAAFLRSFVGCILCLGVGFLNMESTKVLANLGFLSQKIVQREQQVSLDVLQKVSDVIFDTYSVLYDAKGLLIGGGVPFVVTLFTAGWLVVYIIRNKDWNRLLYFCILAIACFSLWIVLPLAREPYNNPPRMSFSFIMIQGLFLLITLQLWGDSREKAEKLDKQGNPDKQDKRTNPCLIFTRIMIGAYVLLQLLSVQNIVVNRYASNAIDETFVKLMYQRILDYEERTGRVVTKLATCNDQNVADHYQEVSATVDAVNERILGKASWSIACDVSGRLFERVDMDTNVYNDYFAGKNWDCFDLDQQLVIQDDTAYWCVY